jgi:hypothetical protein
VPSRIASAEKYMAQLDAMTVAANLEKVLAHAALADAYRMVNNEAKVVSHGELVVKLAQVMDQRDRANGARRMELAFQDAAEIYSTQPSGRAKIDALAKTMTSPRLPDPESVAERLRRAVIRAQMLGERAHGVTANWWLNSDLSGMQTLDVASAKKIRVLQFTAFG